jgi:hypothetical protein
MKAVSRWLTPDDRGWSAGATICSLSGEVITFCILSPFIQISPVEPFDQIDGSSLSAGNEASRF